MTSEPSSQSPGLDLAHGFVHYIRTNQLRRAEYDQEAIIQNQAETSSKLKLGKTHHKENLISDNLNSKDKSPCRTKCGQTKGKAPQANLLIKALKELQNQKICTKKSDTEVTVVARRTDILCQQTDSVSEDIDTTWSCHVGQTDTLRLVPERTSSATCTVTRTREDHAFTCTDRTASTHTDLTGAHVLTDHLVSRCDLEHLKVTQTKLSMAAMNFEKIDLPNYVEEAQQYIKTAYHDPESVPSRFMNDVASTIVNRAWEDDSYHIVAAELCAHITQLEHDQQEDMVIPRYTFRMGMFDACRHLLKDWEAMKRTKAQYWISFCRFLGEVYKRVRPNGMTLKTLATCVLDVLCTLASPACINNFEEADLLCMLFHDCAKDLRQDDSCAMDDVVNDIRDAFVDPNTDQHMQGLLLPLIELYASDFDLSKDAKAFYFQM